MICGCALSGFLLWALIGRQKWNKLEEIQGDTLFEESNVRKARCANKVSHLLGKEEIHVISV